MRIQDRYETLDLLGEGAFGRTFAGRNIATGDEVVLKQISVRGLPGWKPIEQFEREVAVLRTLNHPGVPRFVDAFETEGERGPTLVLVMERIEGETLLARIRRGHRWHDSEAKALLDDLLSTLEYLHGLSPPVIHRDIKPANIMLRRDRSAVLVDFGAVHDWRSQAGGETLSVVGTAGYIAPEQAMGAPVPASDLYALGATLVHALSHCHPGDLPRRGLRMAFEDRVGCSPALRAVLRRLAEPDLRDRYTRAADARGDLHRPTASLARVDLHRSPRALDGRASSRLEGMATRRTLKTVGFWGGVMAISSGVLAVTGGAGADMFMASALAMVGAAGTLTLRPSR